MSVLRPVGPLPARVYWVRRALAVVVAVAALLAAAWAWGAVTGGGEGGTPVATGPTPGSSGSVSPAPSSSPSVSPTPAPSGSVSPSPKPTATGTRACADDDIAVTAATSSTTYPAGKDPRFTVKVTNTSKKACTRNVGQRAMEVRVSQGETIIWSSDHCAPGGSADVITLGPGKSFTTSVVWSRTLSEKGCPTSQPPAPAGTYALNGRNLKVLSEPVAFALA
ncbi:MAG TPA: hypothetical protein VEV13_05045 [Candidatus Limnocylindria bacterium]|nr:hypothetical protein [Candidatus Limnocylindria bacterium]